MRGAWSRLGAFAMCTLTLLACGAAAAAPWSIRAIAADGNADAKFPWVTGPDPAVADRINTLLFLDVLESPPPRGEPGLYTLPKGSGAVTPVTPADFKVLRQDDRVLSIAISAEGCGAYCEEFEHTFVFDLRTGRRVATGELLTAAGRKALARKGGQSLVAAIGRTMSELRKRKDRDLSADNRQTMLGLYEECREMRRGWIKEGRLVGTLHVLPSGAALVFGRCSPHAFRALDELDHHTYAVDAADLASALSPYGRALLLGDGDARPPAEPSGQVFSGSVGGAAIRLYTGPSEDDGSIAGTYYYERYRKPISLFGSVSGGTWTLSEGGDDKTRADWSLKREGSAWVGTWAGADGRRLPVRLVP